MPAGAGDSAPAAHVVVHAPDELDLATVLPFSTNLHEAGAGAPARVVVDMSEVRFCDARALKALVDAAERLAARGCVLELQQPPPSLRRLARLLDVQDQLGLTDAD